jgi:hypothetical protein
MESNGSSIGRGAPLLVPKTEMMDSTPSGIIKQEQQPQGIIQPPPSYQELSAVRRPVQLQTNPLLRQLGSPQLMSQLKMNSRFIKSLQLLKKVTSKNLV